MDHLVRNSDGDELLFIHEGSGDLYCDYGHLQIRVGDYVMLPRGTMWRIETQSSMQVLLIEATNDSYRLPDKGLLGPHAIFDPAMLDVPAIDDAFRAQQDDKEWVVVVKRLRSADAHHLSLQSAGCGGLARRSAAGAHQLARYSPPDESPLSPAAVGAHHLRRQSLCGLHLRAAAVRNRRGRAQGAVLPQQR